MVDIIQRLMRILGLILRQVIIGQNRTGMGHTLEKIIMKERGGIRQITLTLDGMITISIFAVRDLGLLIEKTIDVLTQRLPGWVWARRRIMFDDQFGVHDEALAEDV